VVLPSSLPKDLYRSTKNFLLMNSSKLKTIYSYVTACMENPRIRMSEFHKKYSHYNWYNATSRLIKEAREKGILFGPKIWCNSGLDVELYGNIDDPLLFAEKKKKEPNITYLTGLIGYPSIICFKKGASILQYAETVIPSYPAKKTIAEINLEIKGELPRDEYPQRWDEMDWDVYERIRDPQASFVKAGKGLGVKWTTILNHFKKIKKDCKIWIRFLPKGYDRYQQSYVLFETEYELGLREELKKLDRTTILYKFENKVLLHLFLDDTLQNLTFYKLKRKGKIHNLQVSIPLYWNSKYF